MSVTNYGVWFKKLLKETQLSFITVVWWCEDVIWIVFKETIISEGNDATLNEVCYVYKTEIVTCHPL